MSGHACEPQDWGCLENTEHPGECGCGSICGVAWCDALDEHAATLGAALATIPPGARPPTGVRIGRHRRGATIGRWAGQARPRVARWLRRGRRWGLDSDLVCAMASIAWSAESISVVDAERAWLDFEAATKKARKS